MASVYLDKRTGGWIADFRGVHMPARPRRHVRIPAARAWDKVSAQMFADECDHYARIIEGGAHTPADVTHARSLGVITAAHADQLRHLLPSSTVAGERDPFKPWTLVEAAETHPATRREKATRPADYRKHLAQLEAFATWSGITRLTDLTMDHAARWVEYLRGQGRSWDTRRHHLLYIRRAARMAAAVAGLPDVLGEIILDRNDQRAAPLVWSLAELVAVAAELEAGHLVMERRGPLVIALGGFLGLRPTEIIRIRVGHVAGDVLKVGAEQRKNDASSRHLPMPASMLPWLAEACRDPKTGEPRPAEAWLIPGRCGHSLSPHALDAWWQQYVAPRFREPLPPKHLRKTFSTWTSEGGIEARFFEAYMGHRLSDVAAVTGKHYLAAARVPILRPAALAMDAIIAPALAEARSRRDEHLKVRHQPPASRAKAGRRAAC